MRTGHVGLNVTDLDRSIAFYGQALGLVPVHESTSADRRYAYLRGGDGVTVTLWQQSAAGFAADRAGLHHLAFEVPDVVALAAVEAAARAAGATIRDDPGTAGELAATGQVFFTDPDGTRLEIYAAVAPPRPATDAPACGFF